MKSTKKEKNHNDASFDIHRGLDFFCRSEEYRKLENILMDAGQG